MNAIDFIYNELNSGRVFGKHCIKDASGMLYKYPFIRAALYITTNNYIGYTHYGSSAVKNNKQDLQWVIENIFDTTPEKFLETYVSCTNEYYNKFEYKKRRAQHVK